MSAANWSQGGPPPETPQRQSGNRPPICFNCGQEGHFMVACPEPPHSAPVSTFAPPPALYQQYPGPAPPAQSYTPQAGHPQSQYPPALNQQYGPPAPLYPYNQPPGPQPYVAPPGQYDRPGYQPPPYNQYPPANGAPQYGPVYQNPPQQYGPPAGAPYQHAPNSYPPPNGGYNGSYQGPPTPYQGPPQQWSTPPSVRSAPPYQRQQRHASQQGYKREFSGTPSHQSFQRQTPQLEHSSEGHQQTPQTPASNLANHQATPQGIQGSPLAVADESKASSRANTPFGRRESVASAIQKTASHELGTPNGKEPEKSVPEEGEVDDEEEQFNWDDKYIFKEPPKPETVALAQPLSTTFASTPVPQVDPRSTRSVSRYARNDNIKEFTRSIRSAPQWSYLQEDPAFSDAPLEGPLIPLHEVPAWTAKRHGITEPGPVEDVDDTIIVEDTITVESSRKRAWSSTDDQEDIDDQIQLEAASEVVDEGPANKRQKNAEMEQEDVQMQEPGEEPEENRLKTPTIGTPVLGRSGTPCLANVDDAWAPEPGERAASASCPEDPTEKLLASLGVTGAPKPVKHEPLPPYISPVDEQYESPTTASSSQPPVSSQPAANTPTPNPQHSNTPPVQQNQYASGAQGGSQPGPPSNPSYANLPPANSPNGNPPYANGPPPHAQNGNPQYGPPQSGSWSNAPPPNPPYAGPSHGSPPQYGPPFNPPYNNAYLPPSAQQGYPQYGPPRQPSYGNGPTPNVQYGGPQYSTAPPQNVQYGGPPQYGYGPPQNPQYGAPQYANPEYGNAPPQGPPQYFNGPPQPPYGNAPPQGPPQYANGPPQGYPQYANGPPQGQPQYGSGPSQNQTPYGNVPPRQDSGYVSARGSYSNGSSHNCFGNNPQNGHPEGQQPVPGNAQHNGQGPEISSNPENAPPEPEQMERKGSDTGATSSPLSPTSAEILGKLVQPTRKPSAGKVKRPQPVVADAYSRRW